MSTLTRLLKRIAPFKGWVALGVLLSFLAIGSSVGLMAMSAYLISRAALVTDLAEIALAITSVRLFAILRAVFRYLERVYTHTATFHILASLRTWLYASLEPLAPARLADYRSGDLLRRIVGDIETLENFYVRVVVPPVVALLVTAFACAILGVFNTWLALALLAFLLLTGVVLPLATRWANQQPAQELIERGAGLEAMWVDEVQGMADLLSFDQADQHRLQALAQGRLLSQAQERIARLRGISSGLAALFTGLAGLTVLLLAIPLVTGGQLPGVYLALLPLTAIASFEAVQPLVLALQHLEASQSAARRLFELIDLPPVVIDPAGGSPQPAEAGLEVHDLSFRYEAGEPLALDRVSFRIPAGERAAIVGPSGSGKSTLVSLLLRFWEYEQGSIKIGGAELHDCQAEEVRSMLGVVSQETYLFNATLRDNLVLADSEASEEQIQAACRQAQLHDFITTLPDGYDTLIGENGLLLSGGERQRLAIARVILKAAPLLVLDEATANLDALTAQKLVASLESFMSGRTVLYISHHLSGLERVQQVIRVEEGRVI